MYMAGQERMLHVICTWSINKDTKSYMGGLGANICDQSVTKIGYALKPMITAMENFDRQHQGQAIIPGNQVKKTFTKSLYKYLLSQKILLSMLDVHINILVPNTMKTITEKSIKEWMEHRATELLTYH